jgi:hypothetical protein
VEIARSALKRIMPHLGSMAREDVTPDDVVLMLAALKKSGLSDGTVSRTLDVARKLLPKAATEDVKFRIKQRRKMKIVTREQAQATPEAFARFTEGGEYRRASEAAHRSKLAVDELREDADTLDEFPGIIRNGPGTPEFERELYEAGCLRDGTAGDEIDFQVS